MNVGYLSDIPAEYRAAIDAAVSVSSLLAAIEPFLEVAADAYTVASVMAEADWVDFRAGLERERAGGWGGDEWSVRYSAILLPHRMVEAQLLAERFGVPWGTAYIRAREAGVL